MDKHFNNIRIYNSINEAEEASLLETIKQTPEERLSETVNLIRRVYRDKLEKKSEKPKNNKIKFQFDS